MFHSVKILENAIQGSSFTRLQYKVVVTITTKF